MRIETTLMKDGRAMVGSGSGFVSGAPDLVVTAAHVVRNTMSIAVVDAAGRRYSVRSVNLSPDSDVAILWLTVSTKRPTLLTKTFDQVAVGDVVFAIGNSLGVLPNSLSQGIVAGKRKVAGIPLIQTTAAVSHGNSGGPLLDDRGKVIGVVSFTLTEGQSVNMATAANEISRTGYENARWVPLGAFLQRSAVATKPLPSAERTSPDVNPPAEPKADVVESRRGLSQGLAKLLGGISVAEFEWRLGFHREFDSWTKSPRSPVFSSKTRVRELATSFILAANVEGLRRLIYDHGMSAWPDSAQPLRVKESLETLGRIASDLERAELSFFDALESRERPSIDASFDAVDAERDRIGKAVASLMVALSRSTGDLGEELSSALPTKAWIATIFRGSGAYPDLDLPLFPRIRYALSGSKYKEGDVIQRIGVKGTADSMRVRSLDDVRNYFVRAVRRNPTAQFVITVLRGDDTLEFDL